MHSTLRRSLRRVPAYRALPADRLETLAGRMIYREYRPGDVIWHSRGRQTNFLGIVQQGELLVERRIRGVVIRSMRLSAGDFISPESLSTGQTRSLVLVRALTDVGLQVLPAHRSDIQKMTSRPSHQAARRRGWLVGWLWAILALVLLAALSWRDIARITSGALFLLAEPGAHTVRDEGQRMTLLHYARTVDVSAAFAPNQEGYLLFQEENLDGAAAAFTEAVRRNPVGSVALNNLAVVSFLNGQEELAIELEEKAVQSAPDDRILRYNLGLALVAAGHQTEALPEFMQAGYIDTAWALPHVQRALVYLQLSNYPKAEEAAAQAIRRDAKQEKAHLIRAIALYNQGKYPDALEPVQAALELDPGDRVALFYEAMIQSELQEFEPALEILNQLITSTSDPQEVARIKTEIEAVRHFQQEALMGTP